MTGLVFTLSWGLQAGVLSWALVAVQVFVAWFAVAMVVGIVVGKFIAAGSNYEP